MKYLNTELLKSNIDKIARYDLEEHNLYGSAYIVMQGNATAYKAYWGENGRGEALDEQALFRLASMTKPITAVAILQLCDRGLLSLGDTVKKYLPEFEGLCIAEKQGVPQKAATDVTILHLLTHTSGIGSQGTYFLTEEDRKTVKNTVSFFCKAGLEFEPFTREAYSGYAAFDVLVAIIEKVTGEDYEAFLQQNICKPCGMTDTTFIPSEAQWARMVEMHQKKDGENAISATVSGCVFENFPMEHKLGGAGLVSSLTDYAAFASAMLYGKPLLSRESHAQLKVAHVPYEIMPSPQRWGLGVRVITDEAYGLLPVGTIGWSGAYGSHFWVDFKNEIVAVMMKNSRFDGGAGNASAVRFERAVFETLQQS